MENVVELKCPNCDVLLHASFELRVPENTRVIATITPKELMPYINLLFSIFEKTTTDLEIEEYCSKVDSTLLKENFEKVLKKLTKQEEKVLRSRFGIGRNGLEQTLEEIGEYFSLTGGRIWQIEKKAIKKLKHPSLSRMLKGFLNDI